MPYILNHNHILTDSGYSNYEDTMDLARHRWYYYKEGFSPLLVEQAIKETKISSNDLIIDPFNGSGTTTLTSALLGYASIGIEVNPFTSFLSEAKVKNADIKELDSWKGKVLSQAEKGSLSPLIGFSTFSKSNSLEKWLFNDKVLNAFEGGWQSTREISSYNIRKIIRLSLISSAMENCNATRDGKCLRYRESWKEKKFNKDTFIKSLSENIETIKQDIESKPIKAKSHIIQGDARSILSSLSSLNKFKLCITSPPYLNTFDYTDIYRPELFLGKFVETSQQLYNIRLNTVRSHLQAAWSIPTKTDFGLLYNQIIEHLKDSKSSLMHKKIPLMVQAYFEDMQNILKQLRIKAHNDAQLWLVVSNSAYANKEVPVDLIIADIGEKAGWFLKEIGVLRHIQRRKTRHSPDISELRESVVIFSATKNK